MDQKICKKCNKLLPLTSFGINSKAKDGRHYNCSECQREWNKIYIKTYREKLKIQKAFKVKRTNDPNDVSHIKLTAFDFDRDYSNVLNLLQKIGYDINLDLHEQFLKRVLMKSGKVLKYKDRPKDKITKYFK